MNYIIAFLSSILGYLMNIFYLFFDLIGTPYIWLCIVFFAMITRFLFLPGKIRSARKKKLRRVIDAEISEIKYRYLLSDEESKKQQKREIKAIYKKYRVSQGSGCLAALLQLPIYIALYNVVVHPDRFVPAIRNLYADTAANGDMINVIHNFFGWNIELSPLNLGVVAYIFPLLVFLFTINNTRKTFKGQKFIGSKKSFFKWYTISMLVLQVVMLTCFSFKLPIGISIYWLTNDIVNLCIDYFVAKGLDRSKSIKNIIDDYNSKLQKKQASVVENGVSSKDEVISDTNQDASKKTTDLIDENLQSEIIIDTDAEKPVDDSANEGDRDNNNNLMTK